MSHPTSRQTNATDVASDDGDDKPRDIIDRGMAHWRRERPDIDCSGKAIVGRILRLKDVVLKAYEVALARYGLRYPAYAILATLRVSGHQLRMSPSHLKQTLLMTSGGTSNLLSRLEQQGLIKRTNNPADGRGIIVELTGEGRRLVDEVMKVHADMERELVRMFSPHEQQLLARLLSRMLVLNGAAGMALLTDENHTSV